MAVRLRWESALVGVWYIGSRFRFQHRGFSVAGSFSQRTLGQIVSSTWRLPARIRFPIGARVAETRQKKQRKKIRTKQSPVVRGLHKCTSWASEQESVG